MKSTNQILLENTGLTLCIKREDLIHPFISGNKYRKLKYNLLQAKQEKQTTLLTFGGAYSNHIAAVASAGKEYGFKTIGIIRGEELEVKVSENPTLQLAQDFGMELEFISREAYREKETPQFLEKLRTKWGSFYLLPEGGTNELAVKGCQEILTEEDAVFDFIGCAVGTGGTISGIINSTKQHQKVLGFPALRGDFLNEEIRKFATNNRWELINGYDFGGYGKVTPALIDFINKQFLQSKVPFDPIYTGKMLFGVIDLIQKNYFPQGSKILLIHTGGIQGIQGMNNKLKNKKSPLLLTNVK